MPPHVRHAYHLYAAVFDPQAAAEHGVNYAAFQAACREEGVGFGFGYTDKQAYLHPVFAEPRAYGDAFGRGCPSLCPHYTGTLQPGGGQEMRAAGAHERTSGAPPYRQGDCPQAETLLPYLMWTAVSPRSREAVVGACYGAARAIRRVESGGNAYTHHGDTERSRFTVETRRARSYTERRRTMSGARRKPLTATPASGG